MTWGEPRPELARIIFLERQLAEARAQITAMEKPLRMWAETPGNHRNHAWWLEWEAKLTEALVALPEPPEDGITPSG